VTELHRKGQDFKDGDSDNNFDDGTVLYYGHEASPKQDQAIASLVRRYFQAMSSDDGAAACSLLFSLFAEVIVEDYGSPATGQKSLQGTTCAAIVTKFFKQYGHRGTPRLVGVRLEGKKGLALLQFHPGAAPRSIEIHDEFGTWNLKALLDVSLP
jgi:hypothetical protein